MFLLVLNKINTRLKSTGNVIHIHNYQRTFGDRQKVSIKGKTERYCISRYFSLMRLAYSVLLRVF